MGQTKRIELADGNWAELKTNLTVGDLRRQRAVAHNRGFSDEVLDGLDLLKSSIDSWSFGAVSDEAIDALSMRDGRALVEAMREMGEAGQTTSSSSSSDGTSETET